MAAEFCGLKHLNILLAEVGPTSWISYVGLILLRNFKTSFSSKILIYSRLDYY